MDIVTVEAALNMFAGRAKAVRAMDAAVRKATIAFNRLETSIDNTAKKFGVVVNKLNNTIQSLQKAQAAGENMKTSFDAAARNITRTNIFPIKMFGENTISVSVMNTAIMKASIAFESLVAVINRVIGNIKETPADPQKKDINYKAPFDNVVNHISDMILDGDANKLTLQNIFLALTVGVMWEILGDDILLLLTPILDTIRIAAYGVSAAIKFIRDNLSWLDPIIRSVFAAFLLLKGAQVVYNTVTGISNGLMAIGAARAAMQSGATFGGAIATTTATGAQLGFNASLLACPITWVILAIIALIAVFVIFTEQVVGITWWLGALFKNVGLWIANVALGIWNSIQNIGLWFANLGLAIWAIIKNVGAWFGNLGMGIWEVLGACASNVMTAFSNAWINIQIGFNAFIYTLLTGIKQVIDWLNVLPGVKINTEGLSNSIKNCAKNMAELAASKQEYENIGEAWQRGNSTFEYASLGDAWNTYEIDWKSGWTEGYNYFDTFQPGWGSDAYNAGAEIGAGIHDTIMGVFNIFDFNNEGVGGINNENISGNTPNEGISVLNGISMSLESIYANTSDMAITATSMAKTLDMSREDLKYMRDIAERDAINRFTTADIHIEQHNENHISSEMDLDGVIDYLAMGAREAVVECAEGVHI